MVDPVEQDRKRSSPIQAPVEGSDEWKEFFAGTLSQFIEGLRASSIRFLGTRGGVSTDLGESHYQPELCFVLQGQIVVVDSGTGERTELVGGDLLIIAPNQPHEIDRLSPASEVLWISIAPDRIRSWYNVSDGEKGERTLRQIDRFSLNGTKRIVESILYEIDHTPKRWLEYTKALLLELIALLARSVVAENTDTETDVEKTQKRDDDALDRVRVIVGTSYRERLTLEGIATDAGLSKNYLSTRFHQRFGLSLFAYIAQVRIRHACEYLVTTSSSTQEIARLVGYSNPFYFSRVFKEITGVPPSEYRRRTRNRENL